MTEPADQLSFLGRPCPGRFRMRTLTLQPRDAIAFVPADWADTVVIVERGSLEIECAGGTRRTFAEGAVLVFAGLPLRRLHNAGPSHLVLSALSRPTAD